MSRIARLLQRIGTGGIISTGLIWSASAAPLPLVKTPVPGLSEKPSSAYSIYVEAQAPATVQLAAEEIQRVVELSTGVKLPIVHQPMTPMICLGDNPAVKAAGLSAEAFSSDSFQILTKDQNLYITGKDTPDNFRWRGWESRGTLFGAYDFLEKTVGVRWLMPGEVGEEIPTLKALTIADMNRKESPAFSSRAIHDIQNHSRPPDPKDQGPAQVDRWLLRQKCANIFDRPPNRFDEVQASREKILCGHAWVNYIKPEDMQAHPEFEALGGSKGKFCTSNPAAVGLFAQRVMEWLDQHPDRRSAPISPEDGGDFCKCPKCTALTTRDWHGNLSYTPVILKFYNDVARIVGQKYPDRVLGGYVYYNYMYPPAAPVRMEPNVYLVLAALPYYGWGLAKPLYQEEFPKLISAWTSTTTHFGYCSYSVYLRALNGTPLPPPLPILKQEIPTLHQCGVQSAAIFGIGAWGYGGPENYIVARLLWDGKADVEALFQEWLQKAYGPAGPVMKQFYRMIEDRILERKRNETPKRTEYEVNFDFVDNVYKPIFPEMERLYSQALAQVQTEKQRQRLEMLGDNLIMLHYGMRKADMLKDPEQSIFFRSDEAYQQFLANTVFSLALYRNAGQRDLPPLFHGSFNGGGEHPPMETRKLTIPRISAGASAPLIDGDLSDPVWLSGATAEQFRPVGKRQCDTATQPTTARILYDNENLYLAFACREASPAKILKTVTSRDDDSIFSDDCVEIMLATFPNAKQKFWHLVLNPANAQWDGIVGAAEHNLQWKSAARLDEKGWSAEIAIPFRSLGVNQAPAGKTWPANLAREEKANNENTTWNAVYRAFMEPYSFGEWAFAP